MSTMHEIEQRLRAARPRTDCGAPPPDELLAAIEREEQEPEQCGRSAARAPRRWLRTERTHTDLGRMPWRWPRGRVAVPLTLAAIVLAGAGGSALLFATGSPVQASFVLPSNPDTGLGRTLPSSLALLPNSVADPEGGPPWAMRVIETTRGEACLQAGRVVQGRLGALGIDYAFEADGRFHPFEPADAISSNSCATLDAKGLAFQPNGPQIVTKDGLPLAGENVAPSDRVKCNLPDEQNVNVRCPQSDLREVAIGMLGPDASSITVSAPGLRSFTVTPYGKDGAYLIVLPAPPHADPEWPRHPASQHASVRNSSPRVGATRAVRKASFRSSRPPAEQEAFMRKMVRRSRALQAKLVTLHVSFRNGSECEIPAHRGAQRCKPVGIEADRPMPTSAQLATPLRLTYVRSSDASALAVDSRSRESSFPGGGNLQGPAGPALKITFKAPVAAPNIISGYDVELEPSVVAGCATPGQIISEPTEADIAKGQEVQITVPLLRTCKATYEGRVFYARSAGSQSEARVSLSEDEGPLYEVIASRFGGGEHSLRFPTVGSFHFTAP